MALGYIKDATIGTGAANKLLLDAVKVAAVASSPPRHSPAFLFLPTCYQASEQQFCRSV